MMHRCRETFRVRARGPLACFTRPEFKVERVSYEVMTPSAARGVLEAVHWKPAIRWVVTAIHVLAPVKFISFKRNEVAGRASRQRGPVLRNPWAGCTGVVSIAFPRQRSPTT